MTTILTLIKQMNKQDFFSSDRILIGKDNWHLFLRTLKDELSIFLDCEIIETSMFWDGENIANSMFGCNIDIIANIFPEAKLQYGGVICYSKNFDESTRVDVFFLAYVADKRVKSDLKGFKYLTINYDFKNGWNSPRWLQDEWEEWVSYIDMNRWKVKATTP